MRHKSLALFVSIIFALTVTQSDNVNIACVLCFVILNLLIVTAKDPESVCPHDETYEENTHLTKSKLKRQSCV